MVFGEIMQRKVRQRYLILQMQNPFFVLFDARLKLLEYGLQIDFLVSDAAFFTNIPPVGIYGFVRNTKKRGNLLARVAVFNEVSHLVFCWG
jgi:hypothetical protein